MTDSVKQVPHELRNKSAVGAADVHRDLTGPVAGPSSASTFRTEGGKKALDGDKAFAAFAQDDLRPSSPLLASRSGTRAAQIAAESFTPDDLTPRSRDSVAVAELLANSVSLDDLDDALSFLSKRQEERWQHDSKLPADTAKPASYTSVNHPYLFNLLHLPDEEAITAYLSENTYSNDVWGLPGTLKQDLDVMKDIESDNPSRERALRRLQMLKRHLELDGSQKESRTATAGEGELQRQSRGHQSDGFDYTDWMRIYQS